MSFLLAYPKGKISLHLPKGEMEESKGNAFHFVPRTE